MKVLSAALCAAFSVVPFSAVLAADAQRFEPVVVTASREPVRTQDALADVSVITRAEIEQAGASTLSQLLARQPGVQMTANGGPGKASSVLIRGASGAQTLVLVDGLRFGSATSGGAALEHLSLDAIDHIEIVRGPASALYGSDAVGGVVQIFTRKPTKAFEADAFAGFGRYATQVYQGGLGGTQGDLSYRVRAGFEETGGFSATTSAAKQPWSYNPDRDGYRRLALSGGLDWRLATGHEVGVSLMQNQGRSHYDAGPATDPYADVTETLYGLTLKDRWVPGWDSTLRIGRTEDDARDHPTATSASTYRTVQNQFAWQNDIHVGPGTLMLGAEWLEQRARIDDAYDLSRRITAAFAGWTAHYGAHNLQLNLRSDHNSQFGAHTTGTAAWGWHVLPAWRVRLAGGTAFRAPTFNDLYYPGFSNPDLRPERSINLESGLNWEGEAAHAGLSVYQNRVRDMVALDANWVPQNIARAVLRGASLTGGARWGGFDLEGGFDWLIARDPDTGKRLPRRATRQFVLTASYGQQAWRAGAELKAVGGRFDNAANTNALDAYTLINLFARWTLQPGVQLEARLDNLANKQYETARGYGTPGVSLFAGVRVSSR